MTKYLIDSDTLTDIADAIREQTRESGSIQVSQMASQIESIQGSSVNYSTTEHEVGTWIDGSVLYEKTIDIGAFPNTTTKSVTAGISIGLGLVVSIVGFGYKTTSSGTITIHLPYKAKTPECIDIWYEEANDYVTVNTDFNATEWSGYITLQYTKASALRSAAPESEPEEVNELEESEETETNEER